MKNDIVIYFSSNPFKNYHVASGSIFNKEFSETLDSATVILDEISVENRLVNILPYEYVKVVNKGDFTLSINDFYLIDNFVEKEVNIIDNIYQYTINLMSETKYLEKIQCPNLVITHSKVSGKKTIYQHICQYMELYCPKVKMMNEDGSWSYQYLFKWESQEMFDKFNVECADLSFSQPTLRQLLTSLMLQVGCIPSIKNRQLTFLDYREKPKTFNKKTSVNYIEKSLSSDSFVNALVNNHQQVLDTENEVISESIGFRNKDNVLLKQLDNLTLETKFPIYKVNKFYFNSFITLNIASLYYATRNTSSSYSVDFVNPSIVHVCGDCLTENDLSSGVNYISFDFFQSNRSYGNSKTCRLKNLKVHFCDNHYDEIEKNILLEEIEVVELFKDGIVLTLPQVDATAPMVKYLYESDTTETLNERQFIDNSDNPNYELALDSYYWNIRVEMKKNYIFRKVNAYHSMVVWIECEFNNIEEDTSIKLFLPGLKNLMPSYYYEYKNYYEILQNTNRQDYNFYARTKIDFTPLLVENSQRRLLNTDYTKIPESGTIEDLGKHFYGTIGYNIGTKQISGFSQTYSIPVAWWQNQYSVFENILTYISNNKEFNSFTMDYSYLEGAYAGNMPLEYSNFNENPEIDSLERNFALHTFDIQYQPLNSYSLKHYKQINEIPITIEQLDNAESGIIDFDRTAKMEQEKINRLGNDVLAISQTTDNYSEINDVNTLLGEYTIFKRTISIENEFVKVNYQASKNYVLQNYFSSITTKYRAYEYVDYSQSVIRKENETIFVLIDTYYIDGDRKIKLNEQFDNSIFASGLRNTSTTTYKIKYSYEKDYQNAYKNDVSVISTDNIIAFVYENYDNASYGSYLLDEKVDEELGGIPQQWFILPENYYHSHEVGFLYYLPFFENNSGDIKNNLTKLPYISSYSYENYVLFNLVDNNKTDVAPKIFYKDNAEIINQTVQFVYYTTNDNIKWNHWFLDNNSMVCNSQFVFNKICDLTNLELNINGDKHSIEGENRTYYRTQQLLNNNFLTIGDDKIIIDWKKMPNMNKFKICWVSDDYKEEIDMIAFRKINDVDIWYISLNDTKSKYAFNVVGSGESYGLIYLDKDVSEY